MRIAVPAVRLNVDAAVGRLRELLRRAPSVNGWRARALEAESALAAERRRSRQLERDVTRAVAAVAAMLAWLHDVLVEPAANDDAFGPPGPPTDGP